MAACLRTSRIALFGLLLSTLTLIAIPLNVRGQGPASAAQPSTPASAAAPAGTARPIPDIKSLMEQVEAQEKTSEKTIRHYIYHVTRIDQDFDSHGSVKKTTTEERESFWIDDTFISRLLSRDGKPISGDELKKQNEEIDKRIAAAKERAQEKAAGTAPPRKGGGDEVTFARFLELGTFSNPRRVTLNGRDTIAVDYAGDPKAKTRNLLEGAIHDLAGTVWVDEQDHAMVRIEGHFFDDFKVAGGLLADIHKGSWFEFTWTKVNDEVWLPEMFRGKGSARIAVFFNHSGAMESRTSDYRKFLATATILPGSTAVEAPGDAGPKTAAPPNSGTAPPP
ncbi:MAG: hypothetical protein ABR910_04925 [Acidobacteriaceae bacterium]|jgi:hypothetical protein